MTSRMDQPYSEKVRRNTAPRETTLYKVLRAVVGQTDPKYVARATVEAITKIVGWPNALVAVLDEDGTHWVAHAAGGRLTPLIGRRFHVDEGVIGRVFRTTQTQWVPDVSVDPDYVMTNPAICSELAVPIQRHGRILGVLDIESDQLAAFDEDDILLVESLADAVSLALDNAHLYSQVHQNAANLSALYTVTRLANRSFVLENVLEQALSAVLTLLGFEAGLIGLIEPTGERLSMVAEKRLPPTLSERLHGDDVENGLAPYIRIHRDEPAVGAIRIGERHDVVDGPGGLAQDLADLAARAYVSIPLIHRGESLGIMLFFSYRSRDSLVDEVALLTSIGHQVAAAVANARLFQTIAGERSRLHALIESSRDGIILAGMDQRLLLTNAPALKLLGLPGQPEDWTERRVRDALRAIQADTPSVRPAALADAFRIVRGDEPASEGEFDVPPRSLRWLNLPVRVDGTSQGRLIVLRAVTEQRLIEKLREDLIDTMVHDLRSPLTAISAALNMLNRDETEGLSARQRQLVDIALEGSERMLELVNTIMDVTRLESGQMELETEPILLRPLVTKILRTQAPRAADKGVSLEQDVPAGLPPVWADAALGERVLQNLVDNAIKFTPAGGRIEVVVTRHDAAPEDSFLYVSVKDNGPGIPAALKDRLFQKFATGRQGGSGSGLGLAFCKLVVEMHGGRIWVESAPDQGATFTFGLPIVAEV